MRLTRVFLGLNFIVHAVSIREPFLPHNPLIPFCRRNSMVWSQFMDVVVTSIKSSRCLRLASVSSGRQVWFFNIRPAEARKRSAITRTCPFLRLDHQLSVRHPGSRILPTVKWRYTILDEAQASSVRWKTLFGFHCRNRLLLTGTPIQNNMQGMSSPVRGVSSSN